MHIWLPGEGPFSGPIYLTKAGTCQHKLVTWAEHYQLVVAKKRDSNLKVVSPHVGLHPLVGMCTDILAMTKLEPEQINHKIQGDFVREPMLLHSSPRIRNIITKQMQEEHIYLVCE
jgi:hypothetical protein